MTKKQNTVLFILIGTLSNIVLTVLLIIVLTVLGGIVLQENLGAALPFIFIIAVIGGMIIYQKLTKIIVTKFNLEEKMMPLFGQKRK